MAVSVGLNEVSFDRLLIAPAKGSLSCEAGRVKEHGVWEFEGQGALCFIWHSGLFLNDLWTVGLSFVEVWEGWL